MRIRYHDADRLDFMRVEAVILLMTYLVLVQVNSIESSELRVVEFTLLNKDHFAHAFFREIFTEDSTLVRVAEL